MDGGLDPCWSILVCLDSLDCAQLLNALFAELIYNELLPVVICHEIQRAKIIYLLLQVIDAFRVNPVLLTANVSKSHVAWNNHELKGSEGFYFLRAEKYVREVFLIKTE